METPADKAQTNFTDPELSIMKTANKGWDYCGNAQASVDDGCQIIVACDVTEQCNDKQQAEPMAQATRGQLDAAGIAPAADESGARPMIPAVLDTGYFSAAAVEALEREGFDPYIATERQRHHGATTRRGVGAGGRRPRRPRRRCGRSCRRRRVVRCTHGGRRSSSRSLARSRRRGAFAGSCCAAWTKIRGEWRLVCLTHNLLKIWRYGRSFLRGSRCALIN